MLFQGTKNFPEITEQPPNSSNCWSNYQPTKPLVVKFKETRISITCTCHWIVFRWLVKTVKSAGHVPRLEKIRNAYKILNKEL